MVGREALLEACGAQEPEASVGPVVVVVVLEFVQGSLEFGSGCVGRSYEEFVSELVKEAFDVPVLPRLAGLDEARLYALREPERTELGTVVGDEPFRLAVHQEQPFDLWLHRKGGERRCRLEQQALLGEAVQHRQNTRLAAILQPPAGKVHAPRPVRSGDLDGRGSGHFELPAHLS